MQQKYPSDKNRKACFNYLSIIFKMLFHRYHFLFAFLIFLTARNQVLVSSSFCLGNCMTCDHFSLTKCLLPNPCDYNFYSEKADGVCYIAPSTELVSQQLMHSSVKVPPILSKGWSKSATPSHCEYVSSEGKRYVQILGLYTGWQTLEKVFEVDPRSDSFELSFDILMSEWMPFSDFLIVDISSQDSNLASSEISFESVMTVESQAAKIICGGTRVMSKKYSLKFANHNRVNGQITVVFTSFLQNAVWGITNLRLQQGCLGYSLFNPQTQKCSKCDSDSYLVTKQTADWCEKCPSLCKTCQSSIKCLTCVTGATLNKAGICDIGSTFKTQVAGLGDKLAVCDGHLKMAVSNKIAIAMVKNDDELIYDELQVGFALYYLPAAWNSSTKSYISVKINKKEVMRIGYRNLTNVGVNRCLAFKDRRAAKIQIFSERIAHKENAASVEYQFVGDENNIQFGVGSVRLKSIIKHKTVTAVTPAPSPTQVAPPTSAPTVAPTLASATATAPITTQAPSTAFDPASKGETATVIPALQTKPVVSEATAVKIPETTIKPALDNGSTDPNIRNTTNPSNKTVIQTPNLVILPPSIAQQQTAPTSPDPNATSNNSITPSVVVQPNLSIPNSTKSNHSQTNTPVQPTTKPQEAGSNLQKLIAQIQQSSNISFIPTSSKQQSGLQIYVHGQLSNSSAKYKAFIDRLDSSQYRINSYVHQNGKICFFLQIDQSFTNGSIAIYSFASSRLLTDSAPQLVGMFKVARFDSLASSQIKSKQSFAYLFSVVAWLAVILVFMANLIGYGVTVEQFIVSLQILFMHIYLGCEYLPLTFRDVIGGLNVVQSLNFFVPAHKEAVQGWLGDSSKNIPVRFFLYSSETFFLQQFYAIIIVNVIYLIWFGFVYYAGKRINEELIDEEKQIHHRVIDNIANRVINFFDQIWRYQFLSTIWFCFVQFYGISSASRATVLNGVLCILAFICSISWPVFVTFYCRRQYYQLEYSEYLYFYEDIYFGKIPHYELPSTHHRIGFPLFRAAKLFYIALVSCYFGANPILALFCLLIVHVAQLLYTKNQEIYLDKKYWLLRVIENGLFVVIQLITGVMLGCNKIVSSSVYKAMGYFLSGLALLVVINGAVRVSYLGRQKYQEIIINEYIQQHEEKKPITGRVV